MRISTLENNLGNLVTVCEYCLTANQSAAKFCRFCWKDISLIESMEEDESYQYVKLTRRKRNFRKWAKRGAIYLMILSLFALYFFDRSAPPGLLLDQPLSNISLSQGEGVWSTPRGGNEGIARAANDQKTPEGEILWKNRVASQILSSPSVADKIIFATTYDEEILALDSTDGSIIWSVKAKGPLDSSPVIAQEDIYIAYRDGTVISLNKNTGIKNWSVELDNHIFSWVVIDQGMLFALSRDGKITSLDALTGATRWKIDSEVQFLAPPAIQNGTLVAPGLKRRIFAIDGRTGRTNLTYFARNAMVGSPAVSGNIAVLGGLDRHVRAIDITKKTLPMEKTVLGFWSQFFLWGMAPFPPAQSGAVWTRNIGHEVATSPAISGNRVVVTTKDGKIMALTLSKGKVLWEVSLSPDEVAGSPTIVNSTFFVTTNQGYLKAYQIDTGALLWELNIGSAGTDSIAYANGQLYFNTENGTIYGVK